ncbi:MAG: hypothetical protein ACK5IB_14930 [Qingshengfaniella sp.]
MIWFVPVLTIFAVMAVSYAGLGAASWPGLTMGGIGLAAAVALMAAGVTLIFGLRRLITPGRGAVIAVLAVAGLCVPLVVPMAGAPGAVVLAVWAVGIAGGLLALGLAGVLAAARGGAGRRVSGPAGVVFLAGIGAAAGMALGVAELPVIRRDPMVGVVALGGGAVLGLALLGLHKTRPGLILRAAIQNAELAAALGHAPWGVFLWAMLGGIGLIWLGGLSFAMVMVPMGLAAGAQLPALVLAAVLLGGLGSVRGALWGALVVGLAQGYASQLPFPLASCAGPTLAVLLLVWWPGGVLPVARSGSPKGALAD